MDTIWSFVQYGFVQFEAYKLNSLLWLSEKIVALFHPSTACYFCPLNCCLMMVNWLGVYLLYAGMHRVLKV